MESAIVNLNLQIFTEFIVFNINCLEEKLKCQITLIKSAR